MAGVQALIEYLGLMALATFSVAVGAHSSLPSRNPLSSRNSSDSQDQMTAKPTPARITIRHATLYPVVASVALGVMYMAIQHLGRERITWYLGWCLALVMMYSVSNTFVALFQNVIAQRWYMSFPEYRLVLVHRGNDSELMFSFRMPDVVIIPLGLVLVVSYYLEDGRGAKFALSNNVIALSLAHQMMSLLRLDSFRTGCVLLTGLCLYDIWWVFGTDVMTTVATNIELPLKIMWPRSTNAIADGYVMLGLGDIVVPGLFVALALRYDYIRSLAEHHDPRKFSSPYFTATMAAYVGGLALALIVMLGAGAAQPALLYLSPACICSFLTTAAARGELQSSWAWIDAERE